MDGIRKMISYARTAQDKALITLLGFEGLRVSEARSLRMADISLADMSIKVRGKGDKDRTVPLSEEAWSYMSDAYYNAESVGRPRILDMADSTARRCVRVTGVKAGMKRKVSSHDGRSTLATAMLDNGANVRVIQEVLGHARLETTQIYTGVVMESMRAGMTF